MGKIKVIFLDVDGVLNSDCTARRTQSGYTFVDNKQMKNLKHIINMTGAKVVLSSDWRYDRDDPRYNGDYLELEAELLKYGVRLYGFTPELPSCHRGMEIDCWLKEDIEPNKDHWVQTVMRRGLGVEEAESAIRILNGK